MNGVSPVAARAAGPRAGPAPRTATIAGGVAVPSSVSDPSAVYGAARMAAPGTIDGPVQARKQGAVAAPRDIAPGNERPGDVADLLPPVRYGPPQGSGPGGSGAADWPLRQARPLRSRRLLALMALVFAVGVSLVLPVAGTAAVLFVIALLRAADRAQSGLAVRRSARGPRPTDALVVVASAPWALVRSLLVTIMLAPVLFLAAGIADVVLLLAVRGSPLPVVGSYGAGIFVALNCLGPGSRRPRRQLNRTLNAIARSPLSALATTVVLGALAAAMMSLALVKAPLFWPVPNPGAILSHLPGAHGTVSQLRHLGHGLRRRAHVP
jgi:hypothetical protein